MTEANKHADLFKSVRLGPLTLKNRIARTSPT